MHYYPRIKDLRVEKGLTQKEIATALELKQPHYFRYESGERDLPTDLLIKIAVYYNTTTDYILGLSDSPQR